MLAVLYLLFTHGYNADGEPTFADEAIRLVRLLERLMPGQPEVAGLLALFLFQHSRRDARRDAAGNLLTLDKQDRRRWDHAAIAEGLDVLARTRADGRTRGRPGSPPATPPPPPPTPPTGRRSRRGTTSSPGDSPRR